ncbi:uncharacterized protein LOC119363202 isoform X2 [Triticum dicoccoides]|uniref:uncharacterized protein LOC119363202 isoform X2 n=1 Tax=Triticum dicoccoides TaxID=85692 RepID=UPI00188EABE9|nr:uncharacterized protein LOC119363202 isoform X2 [Triticum dicoccoides]XP_037484430.1 uncharacterized protein LOC119363202 isoform X2 [Triticum dicoccoides]
MGVLHPELVMKSIVNVVMAGRLGSTPSSPQSSSSLGSTPGSSPTSSSMVTRTSPAALPTAWPSASLVTPVARRVSSQGYRPVASPAYDACIKGLVLSKLPAIVVIDHGKEAFTTCGDFRPGEEGHPILMCRKGEQGHGSASFPSSPRFVSQDFVYYEMLSTHIGTHA